jgi:hypothetical protein
MALARSYPSYAIQCDCPSRKGMPKHTTMQDIQGASGSVFIVGSNTVSRRPLILYAMWD